MSWRTLTWFGDSIILIPLAVIIALIMPWKNDDRRAVWLWILAFCLAGAIVSLSKIAFMGFGFGSVRFNFTGFSGHSALASTLWPVMFWLLSASVASFWRKMFIAVGYMVPLLIGCSRLMLNAHSDSEVISGLVLGYSISTAFLFSQRRSRLQALSALQLSVALLVPLLIMANGHIAPTQRLLAQFSASFAGLQKSWTRADLHQESL